MNKLLATITTPMDSVNDDSVIITQVMIKNGEKVTEGQILAEIETSKALVEIPSTNEGFVRCLCKVDQEISIGAKMFEIYENADIPTEVVESSTINNVSIQSGSVNIKEPNENVFETKFSTSALNYIEGNNIDKSVFKGYQFVTKEIINNILFPDKDNSVNNRTSVLSAEIKDDKDLIVTEKLGKQKMNEARYLASVNSTGLVSRLSIPIKASMENIANAQNFITTSPLPIITHEVSRLLKKYPKLNSYLNDNAIQLYNSINVGVAFDNGELGLKVASLDSCSEMNLLEIEEKITDLTIKYNDNSLSLEEISSATFTITDLFNAGVKSFHPLINFKNAAVLGVCGIYEGYFNLELSFDHRITSGLEVSKFLADLKFRLENRLNSVVVKVNDKRVDTVSCEICLRSSKEDLDGNLFFLEVANSKISGHVCSNCFNGL